MAEPKHPVSKFCGGKVCGPCLRYRHERVPATHKLAEDIPPDDPLPHRHELTQYVCCAHYAMTMGPVAPCYAGVVADILAEEVQHLDDDDDGEDRGPTAAEVLAGMKPYNNPPTDDDIKRWRKQGPTLAITVGPGKAPDVDLLRRTADAMGVPVDLLGQAVAARQKPAQTIEVALRPDPDLERWLAPVAAPSRGDTYDVVRVDFGFGKNRQTVDVVADPAVPSVMGLVGINRRPQAPDASPGVATLVSAQDGRTATCPRCGATEVLGNVFRDKAGWQAALQEALSRHQTCAPHPSLSGFAALDTDALLALQTAAKRGLAAAEGRHPALERAYDVVKAALAAKLRSER